MLKCWSEEPEQRPSFSALAKTFERIENDTSVSISIMMFFLLFPIGFVHLGAGSHRYVFKPFHSHILVFLFSNVLIFLIFLFLVDGR